MGIAQGVGGLREVGSERQVVTTGLLECQLPRVDFHIEHLLLVPKRAAKRVWEWWVGGYVGVDYEKAMMTGSADNNKPGYSTVVDSDCDRGVLPWLTEWVVVLRLVAGLIQFHSLGSGIGYKELDTIHFGRNRV